MSCERENQTVCRCPVEGDKPLSLAVIDCISEADGHDLDTHPPLYEVIDPEALNKLFRDQNNGEVRFAYLDYEITVTGDAVITRMTQEQPVSAD